MLSENGYSQDSKGKVELIGADVLAPLNGTQGAQRLLGNVRFKYEDTRMFCDSAYYYPNDDYFDAWGHIRIIGESEKLFGDSLHIDRGSQEAQITGDVRMTDGEMTLKTSRVHYDLTTKVASYFGGGTIVSSKSSDRLTSLEGFYDTESKFFHFRKDVVLKNPEYTIDSDTLKYAGFSEKAWFLGPTTITSENSVIYCENGWYESKSQRSQFSQNAEVHSGSSILKGDSIFYDGESSIGEIFENVYIRDTTNNYEIIGNYGWYNELSNESLVTKEAMMIQAFEEDSLYLGADTLRSNLDSLNNNLIKAYRNVRFYKSDLQGKSDSLMYSESDSILTFYSQPVLWSDVNQISGDTIHVTMSNQKIDKLIVNQNGFIISQIDSLNYNQIKGRQLTGKFVDNQIRKLRVEGNVEVVCFPLKEEQESSKIIGYNKVECSNLDLELVDNEISRIKILEQSDGVLHPMSTLSYEERLLKNFKWFGEFRPLDKNDLFRKIPELIE